MLSSILLERLGVIYSVVIWALLEFHVILYNQWLKCVTILRAADKVSVIEGWALIASSIVSWRVWEKHRAEGKFESLTPFTTFEALSCTTARIFVIGISHFDIASSKPLQTFSEVWDSGKNVILSTAWLSVKSCNSQWAVQLINASLFVEHVHKSVVSTIFSVSDKLDFILRTTLS